MGENQRSARRGRPGHRWRPQPTMLLCQLRALVCVNARLSRCIHACLSSIFQGHHYAGHGSDCREPIEIAVELPMPLRKYFRHFQGHTRRFQAHDKSNETPLLYTKNTTKVLPDDERYRQEYRFSAFAGFTRCNLVHGSRDKKGRNRQSFTDIVYTTSHATFSRLSLPAQWTGNSWPQAQ
jgi:hypothetical protein